MCHRESKNSHNEERRQQARHNSLFYTYNGNSCKAKGIEFSRTSNTRQNIDTPRLTEKSTWLLVCAYGYFVLRRVNRKADGIRKNCRSVGAQQYHIKRAPP